MQFSFQFWCKFSCIFQNKMWELCVFGDTKSFCTSTFKIPPDDIVFSAIIRRGPTVHIGKSTLVRCYHVGEWQKNSYLSFNCTLLEATLIEQKHPEFVEDGIMGRWRISKIGNTVHLKFLHCYHLTHDFLEDVFSAENPQWIKKSYSCVS